MALRSRSLIQDTIESLYKVLNYLAAFFKPCHLSRSPFKLGV